MSGCLKYIFWFFIICVGLAFVQNALGIETTPRANPAATKTTVAAAATKIETARVSSRATATPHGIQLAPTRTPTPKPTSPGLFATTGKAWADAREKTIADRIAEREGSIPHIVESSVPLDYQTFARYPDSNKHTAVYFDGEVVQALASGQDMTLRVAVDGDRSKMMLVTLYGEPFPLEGDHGHFWGYFEGTKTYRATLGNQITLPLVDVYQWELDEGNKYDAD